MINHYILYQSLFWLIFFLLNANSELLGQYKMIEIPEFKIIRTHTQITDIQSLDYIIETSIEVSNTGVKKIVRENGNQFFDLSRSASVYTTIMEKEEFTILQNWFQQIEWQELIKLENLVIYADDPRCRLEGMSESITLLMNGQSVSIYLGDFEPLQKDVVYIKTQNELLALNPLYQDLLAVAYLNQSFTLDDIWPCLD